MTYEEFKKSALNKQDENDSYLDFKNRVLNKNNTDPLKTLMNATSTYSMGSDGKLVKTPNMEESKVIKAEIEKQKEQEAKKKALEENKLYQAGKIVYDDLHTIGIGVGGIIAKPVAKGALALGDVIAGRDVDWKKNSQRVDRAVQNIIEEHGNNTTLYNVTRVTTDIGLSILGTNALKAIGMSAKLAPVVSYGAVGGTRALGDEDSMLEVLVETTKSATYGAIVGKMKNLLTGTALTSAGTKSALATAMEFGSNFAKNAISHATASVTTQAYDLILYLQQDPNLDYIDWNKVQEYIDEGKYKTVEEFLDSSDYKKMVAKNRGSQIILASMIGGFFDTVADMLTMKGMANAPRGTDGMTKAEAYKTLGLKQNATEAEVKSAYRKFVKMYHPDVSTGHEAEFEKISRAYGTIMYKPNVIQAPPAQSTTQPTATTTPTTVQPQAPTATNVSGVGNIVSTSATPTQPITKPIVQTETPAKEELTQNTENRTQISEKNAENNMETAKNITETTEKPITSQETPNNKMEIAINRSLANTKSKGKTLLGKINDMAKNKIQELLNIDVTGRRHIIADNDIRHMINEHGNAELEAKKGQIAITVDDIKKIPEIIEKPDDIIEGTENKEGKAVRYIKQFENDNTFVVEVIPNEGKNLIIKTMWKKPVALANDSTSLASTSETQGNVVDSTSSKNIITPSGSYVNKKEKAPITKAKETTKAITRTKQEQPIEKIDDFGEKIGGARKDLWVGTKKHATREVIHNYSIARDVEVGEDGKEKTIYSVKFKGHLLKGNIASEEEAQKFIEDFKSTIKNNSAKVKEVRYRGKDKEEKTGYTVEITDPRTLKTRDTYKIFDNKEEAESYAMALSMYISEHGKNLFRPQIQRITRENPDMDNALKATGQEILDTFKFRGGEFGNWVNNAERQKFLNYGYDALMDLATALDIKPEDLSYGGKMAIAFGARGKGLTSAVAHFEPVAKVINMTRLKGAGSLAHEMGHGLDNFLSQIAGYDANGLISENRKFSRLPEKVSTAVQELIENIQYNISTDQAEIDKKNAIFEKNRISSLNTHLSWYDKVFNGETTRYKKVKGEYQRVPVVPTSEQKKEYERIKKILIAGKLETKRDPNWVTKTKLDWIYAEPLETLKTMIKAITNRKADENTIYWLYRYGTPSQQVKEVKSESAFVKASRELDAFLGRTTPYYNTIAEQIARSFEAFVFDELKKKNITNTYLVHSVYNENYALFNPFPAGEERKNINKAWKNLIEAMKTEGIFTSSEDDGARYDMMPETAVDSQNRKLSKGQQEYFKDSKIRDREGNLLRVYHATDSEFTIFDKGRFGSNGGASYGKGFYFATYEDLASDYGENIGEYYLNIKNPFNYYSVDKEYIVNMLEKSGYDYDKEFVESFDFGRLYDVDLIDNFIDEILKGKSGYAEFSKMVQNAGFDGIEAGEEIIAFEPNQIKRVDNLNPTEDDDTRYDLMPTMKDGFYSQLENVIINKMQKQAKTSDIMNLIQKNGVKQDEIAWTGVDDFLASRDTVTKEELLQYIRANQIEIEEVIKSETETLKGIDQHIFDLEAQVIGFDMELDEILSKYEIPTNFKNHIFEDVGELYNRLLHSGFIDFDDNDDIISSDGPVSEYAFMEDLRRYIKIQDTREEVQHEIDDYYNAEGEYAEDNIGPKFKEFSTTFGDVDENYREILYRMPNIKDAPEYYKREHWDDISNIFAHTRLRDYEDDGGAKVLFIEEIQSDMHQEGRRYGYTDEPYKKLATKVVELEMKEEQLRKELVQELHPKRQKIEFEIMEKLDDRNRILIKNGIRQGDFETGLLSLLYKKTNPEEYEKTRKEFYNIDTKFLEDEDVKNLMKNLGLPSIDLEKIVKIHNELSQKYDELMEVRKNIFDVFENNEELSKIHLEIAQLREKMYANMHKIYSKFPFKKNWYEFIIRKQINEAVQNGYDKVAWTTGTQQNERYNLAKYIEEIRYAKYDDGRYYINAIDKNAHENFLGVKKESELEELVGKEVANKIISGEYDTEGIVAGTPFDAMARGIIENTDLEIGGEGMKGFYDKIVPDYVNKYIKKWNSKVEEVRIPDYGGEVQVQQGFRITPEMRKSVQEIGQPLYDKEPSIDTMSRKNIIEKIRETTGIEYFANTNKELNNIASEIREKIKGRKITTTDIKNIADEIGQKLITRVGGKKASIKDFFIDTYGKDGWDTIAQSIADEIKAIRDEYDLENPIDTSKRARVADKRTRDILHALNISDEEIYDPANAFVQNILESMEKDTEYFSRTLKEIEEENLMFGNKRVNTILNKRRYDVQSGRVKANPKYTEGASLSSIRKAIEAHTGKKIGLNGFRQRAYGIYKPTLDTIRIKNISNVETAIHELGHRINYVELNQSLKGASRAELNKLAERAFGPMYDDKPDVKLEEGWAEFTKRFICDNEATVKEYPQLSTYMVEQLEGNKNMKAVVEKLIELSEQYVNAPTEKQIRKMQSVGQDTDSSDKRTFFGQYMYEVHDDLYDIKRMMKTFAKAMKVKYWDITPELNIYNLMRLARSNEDRVLNVMQYGLIDDRGNRRTEGLGELSELLGNDPEQIQKVRDLLIAMRTLDYTAVGLDTGLSTAEAMKLIKEYSQDKTIMRVANGIITFQDEVMKYAVEKGLMTQEQYEEMKKWNRFYIPLKRVFEGKVNSSSGGTGASKLTKRRTGSMRDIIDPFEAIIQNTSMILDKINQNEIMRTLALLQEKTGIADFYEKIAPPQKLQAEVELNLFKNFLEEQGVDTDEIDLDVVQKIFAPMMNDESKMIMGYMEKGKLQAIEFKDRFIYEAISQSAGNADLGVILERALSVSQLLRLGATSGNIEFAIPNMISDTMTAWMFSESGFVPLVDTLRGLVDYSLANYGWADNLTKDSKYKQQNKFLYDLYKQSGATMATRVGSYRPEVQEYVLEIFGKHANDLLSDDVNVQKEAGKEIMKKLSRLLGKTQDVLSILPELSEQATRFEHFKKDYLYARNQGHNHKNALLKATINTRDITMDFNRMGHTMRVYNRIRAFSGARAQGIYRFIEAVNKMPKKVLGKLGILAGLAIALKAGAGASGNKKEEEITDQVRKDNFIIPLGKDGEVVTIKKPQGTARSIINFAELLYDVGFGNVDEKDYNKVWLNWLKDTIEENAPLELDLREGNDFFSTVANMALPTALEPIIENALNKDFYYGNPIIPYGKEGLRAEDQYDENTSQTAILLGKVLGQSPAKIENLITGWTAGVGQQVLDASDAVLGKVSKDIPDQPSRELNSKTVLRRFFANSFKNSDSVSEVYEQIEKIEQLKEYEEASETELETLEKLNSAKKTMSDLNKQIKGVRNSLTLTSDQKRDKIKELQILRTDVARNALGKELINPASKEQVELYEYYPSKTTFKYEVHANKTVEVEYTEDDVREYARIVKDTYETALAKEQKKRTYKEMTPEEQKKKRTSLLTSARSTAQDKVSREIYRRSR